jgi:hypothetical protein
VQGIEAMTRARNSSQRVCYRRRRRSCLNCVGVLPNFVEINSLKLIGGRFF